MDGKCDEGNEVGGNGEVVKIEWMGNEVGGDGEVGIAGTPNLIDEEVNFVWG